MRMYLFVLLLINQYIHAMEQKSVGNFTTERLHAYQTTQKHFDDLHQLLSDPQIAAALYRKVYTKEMTKNAIDYSLDCCKIHGYDSWVFYDKKQHYFVGSAQLQHVDIHRKEEIMFTYVMSPLYWNQNFAVEIADNLIKVGFERLRLKSIVHCTEPYNTVFNKIKIKNGFLYQKKIKSTYDEHTNIIFDFYRLSKDVYQSRLKNIKS